MKPDEMPDLGWQSDLLRAIRGGEPPDLDAILVPSYSEGLALYRDSQRALRRQVLAQAYPVIRQLTGELCFHSLADDFASQTPSCSGDLHLYGDVFPLYLRQSPVAADFPYLAEVAALEWYIHRQYYAPDIPLLTLPLLVQQCGGDVAQLMSARMQLAASVHLLRLPGNAADIWLAHQTDQFDDLRWREEPQHVLISRPEWKPLVSIITEAEFHALSALHDGAALGEVLMLLLDEQSGSADLLLQRVQQWLTLGLFSAEQTENSNCQTTH